MHPTRFTFPQAGLDNPAPVKGLLTYGNIAFGSFLPCFVHQACNFDGCSFFPSVAIVTANIYESSPLPFFNGATCKHSTITQSNRLVAHGSSTTAYVTCYHFARLAPSFTMVFGNSQVGFPIGNLLSFFVKEVQFDSAIVKKYRVPVSFNAICQFDRHSPLAIKPSATPDGNICIALVSATKPTAQQTVRSSNNSRRVAKICGQIVYDKFFLHIITI